MANRSLSRLDLGRRKKGTRRDGSCDAASTSAITVSRSMDSCDLAKPSCSADALSTSTSCSGRLAEVWTPPPFFVKGFHVQSSVQRMKYIQLGATDMIVSNISLGGGPFGGMYGQCEGVKDIIREALRQGVTFIDTSYWYGQVRSEELIGQALRQIPRRAYYIGTKVGRFELDYARFTDYRGQNVLEAIESSINRLGTKYLDLCCVQIHDYEMAPSERLILEDTLPALFSAKCSGRVRYIGLVGYHMDKIISILQKSRYRIDVVQSCCRGTLADGSLGESMVFLQQCGLGVMNCSPFAMGLLTTANPPLWHPAPKYIKDACAESQEYCQRKKVSLCRLALHYAIHFPGVHTCVVSAHSLKVLGENIETSYTDLNPKEQKVRERIMRRHLDPLANANWELLDVEKYWAKLKRLGITRRSLELALPVRL